ncbi:MULTISPECIES: tyrosine-type recombinase/integrase [Photorhabdus]|uniref:Phage integrase n=1 Tax=Photorhabdus asymbiotica subsp. asymbiotica (strain ATCC 43949 / 3105-77) TaxID=553480 RepID=C7BH65_PHOAA|nr:tyrosine-type recombinase/integrase [Photorhabdus asymbiotica]CAQ85231.1 Putative phage integrase [Photorhabdus asymbiotica]
MARKRKDHNDNKLPTRVSKTKYSYYLKTKDNKTIMLGPLTMSMTELWAKYDGEIANKKIIMTFSKLWGMHLNSPAFTELSARSQKDKLQGAKNILKVFGHINVDNIKPEYIRQYMDIRGTQSKTQANHELSYMSVAFGWGYERGYCKINPCSGVKKFSLKNRDKYITDEEYQITYDVGSPIVKIAMEISYLCASRIGDILKLKHSQISEQGIYIKQGKTGAKQIKQWTDRLHETINYAVELFPPTSTQSYVILNADGNQFTKSGFDNHWREAKEKAAELLGRKIDFTFHDIKAKAISDFEGSSKDKQLFSGHKTESQVKVYDRKTKITPTLDLPKISKNERIHKN